MIGKPFTYEMSGRTFLGGAQKANGGVELPDPPYEDEYGNPIWERKNGVWIAANILPTAEQIAAVQQAIKIDKATKQLLKIIVAANDNTITDAEFLKAFAAGIRNALQ